MKHIDHPDCWCKRCVDRDIRAAKAHLEAWVRHDREAQAKASLKTS